MNSYNHAVLQGRLTFEPDVKTLQSGKRVGKIRLACKSSRGTLFIDIDVWDEALIDLIKKCNRGDEVAVEGELRSNSWETQTGEKRTKHIVVADRIQLINNKYEESSYGEEKSQGMPF